jgi:16S rRNA (guanine1207-N2)-methyltransferase
MDPLITETLRGFPIKFKTKAGVFSKSGIDDGTRLLIDNMEVTDGTLVADLGSGTGVVGFVIAKLNYNGHVHLLDSDIRAVELAKENADLNKFKNVEVFLSDLFSAIGDRTYHQIYSNPPQQMGNKFLEELITECLKHLKSKGELILVVKKNVKPFMERTMENIFGNSEVVAQGREHVILKSIKS